MSVSVADMPEDVSLTHDNLLHDDLHHVEASDPIINDESLALPDEGKIARQVKFLSRVPAFWLSGSAAAHVLMLGFMLHGQMNPAQAPSLDEATISVEIVSIGAPELEEAVSDTAEVADTGAGGEELASIAASEQSVQEDVQNDEDSLDQPDDQQEPTDNLAPEPFTPPPVPVTQTPLPEWLDEPRALDTAGSDLMPPPPQPEGQVQAGVSQQVETENVTQVLSASGGNPTSYSVPVRTVPAPPVEEHVHKQEPVKASREIRKTPSPVKKVPTAKPVKTSKRAIKLKKKPASVLKAGQLAKGKGGGQIAGTGGKSSGGKAAKVGSPAMISSWGAVIRSRIEHNKSYPAAAGGKSGNVSVRLVVSRSGRLQGVSVTRSSGNGALDGAAIKAVRAAGHFPPAPKELGNASYTFGLSMRFTR